MATRRKRHVYTEEFKKQILDLHKAGKSRKEIVTEFNLTGSTFDNWIRQINTSASYKEGNNYSVEQKELLELHKEIAQLKMENDVLKQAALIFGRESK